MINRKGSRLEGRTSCFCWSGNLFLRMVGNNKGRNKGIQKVMERMVETNFEGGFKEKFRMGLDGTMK